jgi:hypothetical protein
MNGCQEAGGTQNNSRRLGPMSGGRTAVVMRRALFVDSEVLSSTWMELDEERMK